MDLSKIFLKGACPTSIGGQAIMEGIMMRGPKRTAIAIRLPDGKIHMKTQPTPKGSKWGKIPLIRGVVNFFIQVRLFRFVFSAVILIDYIMEELYIYEV